MAGHFGLLILAFVSLISSNLATPITPPSTNSSATHPASSQPPSNATSSPDNHEKGLLSTPITASSDTTLQDTSVKATSPASSQNPPNSTVPTGSEGKYCGKYTIGEDEKGVMIKADNNDPVTVQIGTMTNVSSSNGYIQLEPCDTIDNITVTQGNCTLLGEKTYTSKNFSENDLQLTVNNSRLHFSIKRNIKNASVSFKNYTKHAKEGFFLLKNNDSCYPDEVKLKNDHCSTITKSFDVGPVVPDVTVNVSEHWPPNITWTNKPFGCGNKVKIHYKCSDKTQGTNLELEQLVPNQNYMCIGEVFYKELKWNISKKIHISTICDISITMNASATGNSTANVSWNFSSNNCSELWKNLTYRIFYDKEEMDAKKSNTTELTNLAIYTNYEVTVKAMFGNHILEKKTQTFQTLPGIPDELKDCKVDVVSQNSLRIHCNTKKIKFYGPNEIFYATVRSTHDKYTSEKEKDCDFEFKDLHYSTIYTIEIVVFNGIHESNVHRTTASTKYNEKAVIGVLAFFIVLISVALIFVLYKIYILQKKNNGNNDERIELINNNEEQNLLNVEPITAELLLETYKRKIADEGRLFLAEFQSIPRIFNKFPIKEARKSSNQPKNRYVDILPYDYNRVHLSLSSDGSDYINASYIDGYKEPKKYIAAQGPKTETMVDFWRMVWEQQSSIIVMVTRCEEGNRNKCAEYWPSLDREVEIFEDFVVKINGEDHFPDYIIRRLSITNKREKCSDREVTHIQFTSWPDHGVPDEAHLLLKLRRRVNSFKNFFSGPIVVHCSAGVGRTGTYIGIDAMMEGLDADGRMDIYGYVVKLRRQRCLMVQVEAQYILIHQALIEHTQFGETEIPLAELHSTLNTLKQRDSDSEPSLLESEFQRLPKYKNWRTCNIALSEENKKKNRYSSLVPFDYNRVLIKFEDEKSQESEQDEEEDYSTDEDDEDCKYINASYINGYWGLKCLIAAQGPLSDTVADFWQMVFQRKVKTIVMLSECTEDGKEFCSPYWSDEKQVLADYEVEVKDCNSGPVYLIRCIEIRNTKKKESRKVYQYQFSKWTEQDLPEKAQDLVEMIRSIKEKSNFERSRPEANVPVVVHCNNGSTRTGLFCALWNVLESAETEKLVDIFQVVKALRKERQGVMLNFEHYQFLYDTIQSTFPAQNGDMRKAHTAGTDSVDILDETKVGTSAQAKVSSAQVNQQGDASAEEQVQANQNPADVSGNAQSDEDSKAGPAPEAKGGAKEEKTEKGVEDSLANGPSVSVDN